MTDRSPQRPLAGLRSCNVAVPPRREAGRSRFTSFLMLLLLVVVGMSVHGVALARTGELSLYDVAPANTVAAHGGLSTEHAQWRAVSRHAPPYEVPALESETDGDPAAPERVGVVQLAFGCARMVVTESSMLQAVAVVYTARFAASLVLARAPPRSAR